MLRTNYTYKAPVAFVGVFYLILIGWILFAFTYLELIFSQLGVSVMFGFVMIGFIILVSSYFALGIAYRMDMDENGNIQLTSFRRVLETSTDSTHMIEGPQTPFGFLRFRLEKEKAYLFCVPNNPEMKTILKRIRREDPDIRFKHLTVIEKL